jgi:hypothetical protein
LKQAFKGANVIFGTTDFWQHIKDAQTEAEGRNITVNEVAYEREVQQGKNIVDAAAATVDSLDHFILSTLSDSKKWSKGKITFNLHFDAKWKAVEYCKATYPELWKKTSMVQLAHYATNWMSFGMGLPKKNDEGKFVLSMPMSGDAKVPIVDAGADTGMSLLPLLLLVCLLTAVPHQAIPSKLFSLCLRILISCAVVLSSPGPSMRISGAASITSMSRFRLIQGQ